MFSQCTLENTRFTFLSCKKLGFRCTRYIYIYMGVCGCMYVHIHANENLNHKRDNRIIGVTCIYIEREGTAVQIANSESNDVKQRNWFVLEQPNAGVESGGPGKTNGISCGLPFCTA